MQQENEIDYNFYPAELWAYIFLFCDNNTLCLLSVVCQLFNDLTDAEFKRRYDQNYKGTFFELKSTDTMNAKIVYNHPPMKKTARIIYNHVLKLLAINDNTFEYYAKQCFALTREYYYDNLIVNLEGDIGLTTDKEIDLHFCSIDILKAVIQNFSKKIVTEKISHHRPIDILLHIFIFTMNLDIIKFLLELGADINCKNHFGLSPIHTLMCHATTYDKFQLICLFQLLIKHKADFRVIAHNDLTIAHCLRVTKSNYLFDTFFANKLLLMAYLAAIGEFKLDEEKFAPPLLENYQNLLSKISQCNSLAIDSTAICMLSLKLLFYHPASARFQNAIDLIEESCPIDYYYHHYLQLSLSNINLTVHLKLIVQAIDHHPEEKQDMLDTLLQIFIGSMNISYITFLLENGSNINALNRFGQTPLYTLFYLISATNLVPKFELFDLLHRYKASFDFDFNKAGLVSLQHLHIISYLYNELSAIKKIAQIDFMKRLPEDYRYEYFKIIKSYLSPEEKKSYKEFLKPSLEELPEVTSENHFSM
jgi:ankyrin repeat protein